MTLRTPHWTRPALRAAIAIPSLRSLPRYNPKEKGHCSPQNTPYKSPKHHNILRFFFPRISLAVSPFPDLTAKYSQSRFRAVFPCFFPPFELPVSAPLLPGFYSRKSTSNKGSPIAFLTATLNCLCGNPSNSHNHRQISDCPYTHLAYEAHHQKKRHSSMQTLR